MIKEYIEREYNIKVTTERSGLVSVVHTSPVMLFKHNPNRILWIAVNLSTANMFINFNVGVSSTNGILLDPSGGFMSINLKEDLYLVQKEVWIIASVNDSSLYSLEVEAIE